MRLCACFLPALPRLLRAPFANAGFLLAIAPLRGALYSWFACCDSASCGIGLAAAAASTLAQSRVARKRPRTSPRCQCNAASALSSVPLFELPSTMRSCSWSPRASQPDRRAGPPPAWAARSLRFGWFTQRTTLLIKAIHLSLCPWREMRFCLESNLTSPITERERAFIQEGDRAHSSESKPTSLSLPHSLFASDYKPTFSRGEYKPPFTKAVYDHFSFSTFSHRRIYFPFLSLGLQLQ